MKALFLVSVFLILGIPGLSLAQFQYDNQLGMYTTSDGLGATGTSVMNENVDVYLVLTKPVDVENGNVPFTQCLGFELTMTFSPAPTGDLLVVETQLPPFSLDIGPNKDITQGYLDFFVGISINAPLPVVNDAVMLVAFKFFNMSSQVTAVTLGPSYAPGVPGQMDFLGDDPGLLTVMYSKGGSHDAPVFKFNGEAVAVENQSFGSVKALYR